MYYDLSPVPVKSAVQLVEQLAHQENLGTRENAGRGGSAGRIAIGHFNDVIDPHFITVSSTLYTTIRNPKPNPKPDPNVNLYLTITITYSDH